VDDINRFIEKNRCALCWGPLKKLEVSGHIMVVCARGCSFAGTVTEEFVTEQARKQKVELYEEADVPKVRWSNDIGEAAEG